MCFLDFFGLCEIPNLFFILFYFIFLVLILLFLPNEKLETLPMGSLLRLFTEFLTQ